MIFITTCSDAWYAARRGTCVFRVRRSLARRQGTEHQLHLRDGWRRRKNAREDLRARFRSISPGFFETLGVPVLQGRDFRDSDRDGSERVVIISQSVAQIAFSRAASAEPQFALD